MKKCRQITYNIFLVFYLEIVAIIFMFKRIPVSFYLVLFSIPLIILFHLITSIFSEKVNKILTFILTFILSAYYIFQTIFYRLFSNIFSFNTIGLATDIGEFKSLIFKSITDNILVVLFLLVPFVLLIIFHKKIDFKRSSLKSTCIKLLIMITVYLISLGALQINKKQIYSAYNLYYKVNSEIKTVEKFGLATYTRIDIKRVIFGFEEQVLLTPTPDEPNTPEKEPDEVEEEPKFNVTDIDFDTLLNNEENATIKNMLTYFKESSPTNQNEYTGMFKDKNLIFILAEGFNMIAVDPDLTPTLYKLTHEGFQFSNFYSPVFLSTTGGEFQATTGLIPTQEILSNWKSKLPTIYYGLGHSFSRLGYHVQSYHDWTYTYYGRQKTMPTLGFNEYMGCGNGLEKLMSCKWLPSDIDLINTTFPFYEDYERFATYYVSVSGHAPYAYNSTGNSIALKNKDYVKDLPYSNNVKAYLATQIELDRALETLINLLDEKGILQDTVIAVVGDHYPYTLTTDEINEISTYDRDSIVEVNHSNFIIWNSEMTKPIAISKVGSQIDVLPTLLNLFGVEYDSRLIVGKDILSDAPGLAIFSNRSWVSDYGTYKSGKFTLKEGKTLENESEYVSYMNKLVASDFTLSNNIIKYKMYDYLLK